MRPLIVTPTYQEAENIGEFLRRVRAAVPTADILVVDDNSPDGTADIAATAAGELGQIDILRRPKKIGLGDAYRAGFSVGIERGYDVLVQIDADLSHDPSALPLLFNEIDAGADAVIGSRYVPGGSIPNWPWHRRALSKWGNRYTSFVLGIPINDATSGYRAYRADMLKTVDYDSTRAKGYGFQMELAYRVKRAGGKIVEVPIVFTDRVRGHSKLTMSVAAEELTLVTWWGVRDRVVHRSPK
ncbi:MAG TPA: polyprenol monophosphomannose synthase [Acidimicrobiia bacterium]|nr:polyprenol monophosphomannose synthase [Acidimicrobiia bacterium]